MVRTKKAGSVREKQEVNRLLLDSYRGTKKAIANINDLLDKGEPLSDEQFRFLKRAPQLIAVYEDLEKGKQETKDEVLPEGKLRDWIENHEKLTKLVFGENDTRSKLTREVKDKIIDEMGFYRCSCGEIHPKNKRCVFVEYAEKNK